MPKNDLPRDPPVSAATTREPGSISDYSRIASRYDATRDLPRRSLQACYDRLTAGGLFPPRGTVLDAGCGTGQVSLPLAERGYEVRGLDVSREMIRLARSKVRPGWKARYAVGDVRDIVDSDGSFDAVVVSKLFQHIEDWTAACRELIRVVRPGCPIVQINETGAFGNAVRRHFRKRADELGYSGRYIGLNPHSNKAITTFMASQGCHVARLDMTDLGWDVAISYGEALSRIEERLFAEFWYLPAEIHDRLVADTLAWVEAQPDGRDTMDHLKPYLVVDAFRTPSAG